LVAGEALNIGTGRATSVRDLAVLISRLFDGKARQPIFRGPRRKQPAIKYLDAAKARRLLGWSPTVQLEEGLQETIAWYRDHWARRGHQPGTSPRFRRTRTSVGGSFL